MAGPWYGGADENQAEITPGARPVPTNGGAPRERPQMRGAPLSMSRRPSWPGGAVIRPVPLREPLPLRAPAAWLLRVRPIRRTRAADYLTGRSRGRKYGQR